MQLFPALHLPLPFNMVVVKLLFVNMRRRNAVSHTLFNTNPNANIILIQELWFDKIGSFCSDIDPNGADILGGVANPKWDCLYLKTNHGERCKVMVYHHISSTYFNVTNRLDLVSNHHILILDIHLGTSLFCIVNVYYNTDHHLSLGNILDLNTNPALPTILGGDFNTHSQTWSPPGICPSIWAEDLEDWALT
jgi:hypothetical protein